MSVRKPKKSQARSTALPKVIPRLLSQRHIFALTRQGATFVQQGGAAILEDMTMGQRDGLVCVNCGLSMSDLLVLQTLGCVLCQPQNMRDATLQLIHSMGVAPYEVSFFDKAAVSEAMSGMSNGKLGFPTDYRRLSREQFASNGFIGVMIPGKQLAAIMLPPGFKV